MPSEGWSLYYEKQSDKRFSHWKFMKRLVHKELQLSLVGAPPPYLIVVITQQNAKHI